MTICLTYLVHRRQLSIQHRPLHQNQSGANFELRRLRVTWRDINDRAFCRHRLDGGSALAEMKSSTAGIDMRRIGCCGANRGAVITLRRSILAAVYSLAACRPEQHGMAQCSAYRDE